MPGATPYVLVEERSVGSNQSKGRRIFALICQIYAIVLSALLFVDGILSLIASHSYPYGGKLSYPSWVGVRYYGYTAVFSIRVLSAYLMIFSVMFICIELKSTTLLTPFAGMISPLGRGVVYTIVALLVFGLAGNFGILYGIFWLICGILHIVLGARNCTQFYDEGTVDTGSAVVTKSSEETYSSGSAQKNFCRSCGASLRPTDAYCPDCSAAV